MRGQAGIPYATIPGNQPGGDGDDFDDDSGGDKSRVRRKKYMICSTNSKTTTGLPQHVSHLILSSFRRLGLIFEIQAGVKKSKQ